MAGEMYVCLCVKHHCKKCNFRALSDVGWPVPTAVVFISLLRVSDNHKFQIGIQAPVDESKTFFPGLLRNGTVGYGVLCWIS